MSFTKEFVSEHLLNINDQSLCVFPRSLFYSQWYIHKTKVAQETLRPLRQFNAGPWPGNQIKSNAIWGRCSIQSQNLAQIALADSNLESREVGNRGISGVTFNCLKSKKFGGEFPGLSGRMELKFSPFSEGHMVGKLPLSLRGNFHSTITKIIEDDTRNSTIPKPHTYTHARNSAIGSRGLRKSRK
jgi:hypothetical protein